MYIFCSQNHVLDNQEAHCRIYKYYAIIDTTHIGYIHLFPISAYNLILICHSENLGDKDSYSEYLECLCNLCCFGLLKIVLKIL